ncbi:MAG: Nif3-like dinuclear metal center hexameric protein [Fimbriimonadaceae bacterium]|nr:Nif3-like dinuclear metal center hexameric protein [Fimbriimonadaceae bacterium]
MTVQGLNDALCALWPELDRERTVDRVIAGDPNATVEAVAVCWMPYSETLLRAGALGANVVVAHEPTFYDHHEFRRQPGDPRLQEAAEKKARLIEEFGVAVIRCHDVWDAIGEIGVPFEWGRFLGLTEIVASRRYLNVYAVEPRPAVAWARALAARTAEAGQRTVEFYGDPDRLVRTIGVGTGCCSDALDLYDLGADLAVTVDDIARAWIIGEYCHDEGRPLVVVNHGVSEDGAMDSLARAVGDLLPGVPVHRIRQGASYREVTA